MDNGFNKCLDHEEMENGKWNIERKSFTVVKGDTNLKNSFTSLKLTILVKAQLIHQFVHLRFIFVE
jgi:hypothetical protein